MLPNTSARKTRGCATEARTADAAYIEPTSAKGEKGRKKRKKELINKHPSSSVQAAVNTRGVSVAGVSRSAHSIIQIRQVDEPQPSVPPDRHSDKHLKERRRKKNTYLNKRKERIKRKRTTAEYTMASAKANIISVNSRNKKKKKTVDWLVTASTTMRVPSGATLH